MNNKGFTLIELLVAIAVIGIISTILVVNWRTNEKQYLLQRVAQEVVLDIRKTQNMALNSLIYEDEIPPYYGLYFSTQTPSSYQIFADKNGDNEYDSDDDSIIEAIDLAQGIEIASLSTGTNLYLTFSIPDGFTTIKPQATSTIITIKRTDATCPSKDCKNIIVINTGQVSIGTEITPQPSKTCIEQGGDICQENETCPGTIIPASDSDNCCNVECETIGTTENLKDISKYSVFLISDKNWEDVLSLVPVTTWTGNENCNKGYGTPDDVCVYPTLIFHDDRSDFIVYDRPITTDSYDQETPFISGSKIVWADLKSGGRDIYMYDLSSNQETRITTNSASQNNPSISADKIVWEDDRNGNWDIYMYDLSANQERQITTDSKDQFLSSVSGNKIVWVDTRNGNYDIYLYDLSINQERQITTNPASQKNPSISGDKIVWQDTRNGKSDIYMYDLSTNQERQITTDSKEQGDPSISGDKIVWTDGRNDNWDIYLYDLSTNQERQITTGSNREYSPSVSGDKIVWQGDRNVNSDIYIYDANGRTIHGQGFDADSLIYFLQQYSPDKVKVVGNTPQELDNLLIAAPELGAGLSQGQIQRISVSNYLSYWKSFKDVVYVEDNYEIALLASTYASLINAPLIIKGTSLDTDNVFTGRNVICVGDVTRTCNENYNLWQLQDKYAQKTNTDKIVLVNPNDLYNIKMEESIVPEKSANLIYEIYSKTSLSAPILASGKHELIISTTLTDYSSVDSFIENKINGLGINPEYLTIVASPDAIGMVYTVPNDNNYYSADSWYYSRLDANSFLDLAVGRIFGLTISDVSSNIARSLFYEQTLKNGNNMLVTRGVPMSTAGAEVYAMGRALSMIGYQTTTTPAGTTAADWRNKFFIIYNDHGSYNWAGFSSDEIPYLDNSFIIAEACYTCGFKSAFYKKKLFCANAIRRGTVGYIGATDPAGYFNTIGFLAEVFSQNATVGKAFINSKNSLMVWRGHLNNNDIINPEASSKDVFTLIGDPTLKLKTIYTMPKPQLNFVSEDATGKNYKLIVPAMRIEIPEEVRNLDEWPTGLMTAYFTTAYNGELRYNNLFTSKFPAKDFNVASVQDSSGNSFIWLDKQTPDYWWVTLGSKNQAVYRYFTTANDYEFTNFEFDIKFLK